MLKVCGNLTVVQTGFQAGLRMRCTIRLVTIQPEKEESGQYEDHICNYNHKTIHQAHGFGLQ